MIPIETMIGWGATVAAVAGHAYVANYRINQSADEIKDFWKWKNIHEREVNDKRLEIQKQFGELIGRADMADSQFAQILDALREIKEELKEMRK